MVNLPTQPQHTNDPYTALNLPHTAIQTDIKKSYRQLAKKYHPDTWSAPCFSDAERKHATEIFQKISEANALLTDSSRKAEYDRNHRLGLYKEDTPYKTSGPRPPHRLVRPPSKGAPPPLSRGWTTAIDPSSGSLYYCHVSSGKSSWTHPALGSDSNNSNSNSNSNININSTREPSDNGYGPRLSHPKKQMYPGRTRGHATPPLYNDAYYSSEYDRTIRTSEEHNSHRCGAFLALWLCPPLGIIACYHSIMVDRCQKRGHDQSGNGVGSIPKHHEDIIRSHSLRAGAYACLGNSIGILFGGYWLLFREDSDFEWPREWNLDEWWSDDP